MTTYVEPPSPAANNGRNVDGTFARGNKCGKGNPLASKAQSLRFAVMAAVSVEDVMLIMASLIEAAKAGNITAAREVLDRCIGKPLESDVLEKIAELEAIIGKAEEDAP